MTPVLKFTIAYTILMASVILSLAVSIWFIIGAFVSVIWYFVDFILPNKDMQTPEIDEHEPWFNPSLRDRDE